MAKKQKIVSLLSENRRIIQIILGISLYFAITYYSISLWWIFAFGTALGIILGKVFCRWACPLGIMMELFMKLTPGDSFKNMYQYHKIGCPIAWTSGLLNKYSFFKIQFKADTCKSCGLCDKACYMPSLDKQKFSLYKPKMTYPAEAFSCSKCLQCVAACPNGSLSYKPDLPFKIKI